MGLRELKKEQTRQLIADTAWRLFGDRGFEQVSVAEVAREAQVAEATVYNYFATKEDLFFWRLEAFGTRLAEAVAKATIAKPRIPVLSNVDAKSHDSPEEIRRNLVRQVVSPVLWEDSMRAMLGQGVDEFYEVGPGRVLRGLMKRIDRKAACHTVNDSP